jgi:ribonuclease VapC
MFIDASAFVSLLTNENDARELLARLQHSPRRITSPAAIWETVINVARILDTPLQDIREAVDKYLEMMTIQVMAIPPKASDIALEAFERYGKGRHPAALNFGDCFAYACARYYRVPLLYKGTDFTHTDMA